MLGAGLLLFALLSLPGCASRQQVPDPNDPEATTRSASYRVALVNDTDEPVHIRYTRYQPQQEAPILDPREQDRPQTLNISLSFDDIKPGATALLDVIPGTTLTVTYRSAGKNHRSEKVLDGPMNLSVTTGGLSARP